MKHILLAIGVSFYSLSALAQNDEDALRYSQTQQPFGTARSIGVGGAFGALGADFSSLNINPAGIAMYKGNEFTLSAGFSSANTESDFTGKINEARKYNLNLSNAGLVFTWIKDPKAINNVSKWKSFSFAMGANRIANFHQDVFYKGFNNSNSLVNSHIAQMNGNVSPSNIDGYDPFGASLFYQTDLINHSGNNQYNSPLTNGGLEQAKSFTTRGGITDYNATFGGNYNDKLMLGIGVGVPSLRYLYESTYSERDINDSIANFNSFDYSYDQKTTGIGINARLGLIYKANDLVRVGVSLQTPTYFSMQDTWDSELAVDYNSGRVDTVPPYENGQYNYALVTPWKVTASAAFVIKQYGFIGIDYDWQDYSEANYSFNNDATTGDKEFANAQNQLIKNKYTGAGTLRVGGELALNIFRIRAGYGLGMTPFKSGLGVSGFDQKRNSISAGFGFMEENYFVDLGFRHTTNPSYEQPYFIGAGSEVPGAKLTNKTNHFVLTLGLKF